MGGRKLTIVVPCTDRKTLPVDPSLTVRNLPAGTAPERAATWARRAQGARRVRVPVRDLYRGESWTASAMLTAKATELGYRPDVVVTSAGMGLLRLSDLVPAYGATFARRQADTVAPTAEGARDWWHRINRSLGRPSLAEVASPLVLVVLSETYSSALIEDLATLGQAKPGRVLMFGGSEDIDGVFRVPVDGGLRAHLGGTMNGLALRMAAEWLQHDTHGEFASQRLLMNWNRFAGRRRVVEDFGRTPLSDEDVTLMIKEYLQAQPNLSRSRALRQFRDAGYACEYKRFMGLFERVACR